MSHNLNNTNSSSHAFSSAQERLITASNFHGEYDDDDEESTGDDGDDGYRLSIADNSINEMASVAKFGKAVGLIIFTVLVLLITGVIVYVLRAASKQGNGNNISSDDTLSTDDDSGALSECYISPSCNDSPEAFDPTTGFTNYTGWSAEVGAIGTPANNCCQICSANASSVTCFDTSRSTARTGAGATSVGLDSFSARNRWIYRDRDPGGSSGITSSTDGGFGGNAAAGTDDEIPNTCHNKTGDQDYDYLLLDLLWLPQFCAALSEGHDPTLSHTAGTFE